MTASERVSFLVGAAEDGNAKGFAEKAGIPQECLSRIRTGKVVLTHYYCSKIVKAYPSVNYEWLLKGTGAPFAETELSSVLNEVRELRKDVRELREMLATLGLKQVKNN